MSGPASTAQWYLARDGEQFGPISDAEMARFVELGHLKPNDLLWREGFPDWRPAMVVFPPHPRPQPGAPRGPRSDMGRPDMGRPAARAHPGMGHPDMGRPRMMGEPLDSPAPHERAGYAPTEEPRRRKGVLGRIVRLLAVVVVLAAAGGAGYVYRAQLQALVASLTASSSSGPPVAERRSLELPPLAGFRAGNAEAVDAALQSTALWKVIKREFPEWYGARLAEAVQLGQEGKDETVIGQLMGRKLADLRRQHGGSGVAATADRLKSVGLAYLDNLKRLRAHSAEACAGFIRKGEAEPLVVALLQQGTDLTAPLHTQLTATFEAIADGRQTPRVHIRPTGVHHALLETELTKRGWAQAEFKLWATNMAEAPPEKVCQLVHDFFAAQLALPDPEAQTRLLINSVRRVFAAG
jgi:hypothetical protein